MRAEPCERNEVLCSYQTQEPRLSLFKLPVATAELKQMLSNRFSGWGTMGTAADSAPPAATPKCIPVPVAALSFHIRAQTESAASPSSNCQQPVTTKPIGRQERSTCKSLAASWPLAVAATMTGGDESKQISQPRATRGGEPSATKFINEHLHSFVMPKHKMS
jgi:hypothetical protein